MEKIRWRQERDLEDYHQVWGFSALAAVRITWKNLKNEILI